MSIADLNTMRAIGAQPGHFGFVNVDYNGAKTIGDAGKFERRKVEALLRTVLPPAASIQGPAPGSVRGSVAGSVTNCVHGSATGSRDPSYGSRS